MASARRTGSSSPRTRALGGQVTTETFARWGVPAAPGREDDILYGVLRTGDGLVLRVRDRDGLAEPPGAGAAASGPGTGTAAGTTGAGANMTVEASTSGSHGRDDRDGHHSQDTRHGHLGQRGAAPGTGHGTGLGTGHGPAWALCLNGEDEPRLRSCWDGLARDAQVVEPLQESPWGDLNGELVDPFGVRWVVNIGTSE